MEDHSKKKLTLYRLYLTAYLSVLTNQPHIKNINIVDLFAGVGKTEDGHHGSAVIAAKMVEGFSKKTDKNIRLVLNEYKKQRYDCLVKNISSVLPCYDIMNQTADACFSELWPSYQNVSDTRTLFFIDPYGYTQFGQVNLSKLMQDKSIEILIFIPVSHIYRFINKQEPERSVKPIINFLSDCGIEQYQYEDLDDLHDFMNLLKDNFKTRSADPSYIYSYPLKNEGATNSQHCLFFITHNHRGADKFIEAMYKIRKDSTAELLFDIDLEDILKKLVDYLHEYRSNVDINNWRRENGYHYPEITKALRKLESEKKLEIEEIHKRHGKGFYLGEEEKKLYFRMTKS